MHHSERFVLFLAHDYAFPVQHLGGKYWTVPLELQLRSAVSSQHYVVNPYQLSGLVLSPLNFTVIVMFLMHCARCSPSLPFHDGDNNGIGVLPCGHLLRGPTLLASLTTGHCPHSFGWGTLTVSSALSARVPGEGVCIPVLLARPVNVMS